ncbi:ImmA/IrrE family metallo-endopeptidase [Leptospira borgpetersenii]|nr:ImmA/IrrE family metallo-endopeptidase [Leptospira borgpetersenii]URD70655.1 ImmA/IrrE family metallo-endopeptidase [Leptospira borgpetersenii]UVD77025.1 ImmA/IrrE family metallo-endopeptidase [Leptospira borgpetersenii]UZW33589.1 ImmA/IrrE family metallo-endopeptidase [Leptospira borgpetersenii]
MNTTKKGDDFEEYSYRLIKNALEDKKLGIIPDQARLFKKKKYPFNDKRKGGAEIDLSIEIWLPGAENYSFLYLIECKNYKSRIPINDIREFAGVISEISGVNVKGVFIVNNDLQEGAYELIKAKKMMLIQTDQEKTNYEIKLYRVGRSKRLLIDDELLQSFLNLESRLEMKIDYVLLNLFSEKKKEVINVKHLSAKRIEWIANQFLNKFNNSILKNYECLNLYLNNFLSFVQDEFNLKIEFKNELNADKNGNPILAYLNVEKNTIFIDESLRISSKFLFVLAHEIGHLIIHKDLRFNQDDYEDFQESKYNTVSNRYDLENPKNWIEWQANQFASCVLLPKDSLIVRIIYVQRTLSINRNVGTVFCDDQDINIEDYEKILESLSKYFGVSKVILEIRLKQLGLLDDRRTKKRVGLGRAGSFINRIFDILIVI